MNHFLTTTVLLVMAGLAVQSQAAVVLEGTRLVHDAGKGRDATLRSVNTGTQAALTQAWIDEGDSHARPEAIRTPFRLTPTAPRLLQPQEGQAWRVTYAPHPGAEPLPQDRESLFYFNLLDIPPRPEDAQGSNLLQFAIRTRIKLFHRPAGLAGSAAQAPGRLRWHAVEGKLHIHNPSAYHVTLATITLADGTKVDGDMIPPGGTLDVGLPGGLDVGAALRFTWLDDHGAERENAATLDVAGAAAAPAAARPTALTH